MWFARRGAGGRPLHSTVPYVDLLTQALQRHADHFAAAHERSYLFARLHHWRWAARSVRVAAHADAQRLRAAWHRWWVAYTDVTLARQGTYAALTQPPSCSCKTRLRRASSRVHGRSGMPSPRTCVNRHTSPLLRRRGASAMQPGTCGTAPLCATDRKPTPRRATPATGACIPRWHTGATPHAHARPMHGSRAQCAVLSCMRGTVR